MHDRQFQTSQEGVVTTKTHWVPQSELREISAATVSVGLGYDVQNRTDRTAAS
jgi:hypothetical protein